MLHRIPTKSMFGAGMNETFGAQAHEPRMGADVVPQVQAPVAGPEFDQLPMNVNYPYSYAYPDYAYPNEVVGTLPAATAAPAPGISLGVVLGGLALVGVLGYLLAKSKS